MRVVLDTNVLLAALISPGGSAARIYEAWKLGRFELLTSVEQLDELGRVTRYPTIRPLITKLMEVMTRAAQMKATIAAGHLERRAR